MKKDEILDALGGIGAEYIDMAAEEVSQEEMKRKKRRRLLWLIPAAAVLVLGVLLVPGRIRKSNTPEQRLLKAITPAADTLQSNAAHFAELPVEKRVAWYTEVYVADDMDGLCTFARMNGFEPARYEAHSVPVTVHSVYDHHKHENSIANEEQPCLFQLFLIHFRSPLPV